MNKIVKLKENGDYVKYINDTDGISLISGEIYNNLANYEVEENPKLFLKSIGDEELDKKQLEEFIETLDLDPKLPNKCCPLPPGFAFFTRENKEVGTSFVETLIAEGYREYKNISPLSSEVIYDDVKFLEKLVKKYFLFEDIKASLSTTKDMIFELFKRTAVQEKLKEFEEKENEVSDDIQELLKKE